MEKRSFLKLPLDIDVERLVGDYQSIDASTWAASHWDTHAWVSMLLLRGGKDGNAEDFTTDEVSDAEILKTLPYFSWLIGEAGPLGGAKYAFIFRMKPGGVSRHHRDKLPAWWTPFRIHIPITTNDDALLLCAGRGMHIPVGEVWTFDNQVMHGVVNGESIRAHLIVDVEPNPKLNALLAGATWDPGAENPEAWKKASWPHPLPEQKTPEY